MTGSPSASVFVVVALSVSFVFGPAGESATVADGVLFTTVAVSVTGVPAAAPSVGVTMTVIVSPLSPCPAADRSSVAPVAPATTVPFTFQT